MKLPLKPQQFWQFIFLLTLPSNVQETGSNSHSSERKQSFLYNSRAACDIKTKLHLNAPISLKNRVKESAHTQMPQFWNLGNFRFRTCNLITQLVSILWTLNSLLHCVKSVQIRSFFRSFFCCIQTEYRNIRTIKKSVYGHFSRSADHLQVSFLTLSSFKWMGLIYSMKKFSDNLREVDWFS